VAVDAHQQDTANPFSMDEECRNCPALCETRTQVVHGYGNVGADFLLVGERPSAAADEVGVPFAGTDEAGDRFRSILGRLGLYRLDSDPAAPEVGNAFLTYLTRCRDPDRGPTDEEVGNCDPYLNAEVRMINPEVIVPVGQRTLEAIGSEYTTEPVADLDVVADHGERIRGRGFELVPMIDPADQTDDDEQAFVESFAALMASDYRQTKGRRNR